MSPRPVRQLEQVMGTVITIDIFPSPAGDAPGSAQAGDARADDAPDTHAVDAHADILRRHLARARAVLQQADAVFSTWLPDSPVSRLRRGEITVAAAPPQAAAAMR